MSDSFFFFCFFLLNFYSTKILLFRKTEILSEYHLIDQSKNVIFIFVTIKSKMLSAFDQIKSLLVENRILQAPENRVFLFQGNPEDNQFKSKMIGLSPSLSLNQDDPYCCRQSRTGRVTVDSGRKRVYRHLAGFRECKLGVSCTYRTKCSIRWSFFTRPIDNAIANTLYVLG